MTKGHIMTSHIKYGSLAKRIATSDDAWMPAGAQVGQYANKRAARTDITVVISATAGAGAPACFYPSLAELHLNTEAVPLGNPEKFDLTDALWKLEHAAAVGATEHEAAHARHTKWDPRDLMETYGATRKMLDVVTTLEEPRIEAQALRWHPDSKIFLRGCAMEIVGKDFVIPDSRYGAAAAAGLLLARVDAGVLSKAEARTFRTDIVKVLGDETLAALEAIWQNHLRLRDDDYAAMVDNARDWLLALGEDPEDASEMVGESMMGEPMPGEPGEGDGEGEGSGAGEGGEGGEAGEGEGEGSGGEGSESEGDSKAEGFGDKIKGKAARAETRMDKEIVEARGDERYRRRVAERTADRERGKEAIRPHEAAFGKPGGLTGYSATDFEHFAMEREPSADERRAAKSLSRALERIDFRDRAVTKVASVVPPGRLRGRAAVQDAANREKGIDSDVAVWQGKRRKKVESTPLTIGFMVDISGSMGSAAVPMASTQWVVSTAGAHIDASVATVHFGDKVHGVAPKGVREKSVRVFRPMDGTEEFRAAALALDKELTLLDGRGARIVFIASDGVFVADKDADYAATWMPLAAKKGVAVIFLNFTDNMPWGSYGAPVIDCHGLSPAQVATLCGKAAADEVRRMDARV
jgi:hypothetical protein